MFDFPEYLSLPGTLITEWQVKLPLQCTDKLNGLYLCMKRQTKQDYSDLQYHKTYMPFRC